MFVEMQWRAYWSVVYKTGISEKDARFAFYAGAAAMFELVLDSADSNEEQADKYLTALRLELIQFCHGAMGESAKRPS